MANERDDENFGEKKEFERQPPAAQPAQQPSFGQQPTGEQGGHGQQPLGQQGQQPEQQPHGQQPTISVRIIRKRGSSFRMKVMAREREATPSSMS